MHRVQQVLLLVHLKERVINKGTRVWTSTQSGTRTTTIVVRPFRLELQREADPDSHQLHASLQRSDLPREKVSPLSTDRC